MSFEEKLDRLSDFSNYLAETAKGRRGILDQSDLVILTYALVPIKLSVDYVEPAKQDTGRCSPQQDAATHLSQLCPNGSPFLAMYLATVD
jgi:hypothetical protein